MSSRTPAPDRGPPRPVAAAPQEAALPAAGSGGAAGPGDRPTLLDLPARELDEALSAAVREAGERPFRARQIRKWLDERTPESFEDMRDLPRALRTFLAERFTLHPLRHRLDLVSVDGTRKFLWDHRLQDPEAPAEERVGSVESVLIPDADRVTYCISTQAGCPVKCTFCATGYGGFRGNLRASEVIDQVVRMRTISGRPPTNLVYMGMGEPLLNFDAVARSIEVLTDPRRIAFGARRITVSTVGVPDRIRELGRRFPQVKLALSLHGARDELRDELIPLNRKHPLREVLDAVREHCRLTGKLVTFEYVVLPGVNDSDRDVRELASRVRGIPSRINLIGFNPFAEAPYAKPSVRSLVQLRDALVAVHPGPVTIRRSRGEDIQGACGQLSLARR